MASTGVYTSFKGMTTATPGVLARFPLLVPVPGWRQVEGEEDEGERRGGEGESGFNSLEGVYSSAMNDVDAGKTGRALQSFQSLGSWNRFTCLLQLPENMV